MPWEDDVTMTVATKDDSSKEPIPAATHAPLENANLEATALRRELDQTKRGYLDIAEQQASLLQRNEELREERDHVRNQLKDTLEELERVREDQEVMMRRHHDLSRSLSAAQTKISELKKLEANYFSYLKSIRATDDDLSTVKTKFNDLKSAINRATLTMSKKAPGPDKAMAVEFFRKSLLDTEIPDTLELYQIQIYTEKFIVDTLINEVFRPLHLGVPEITYPYTHLLTFIQPRNPQFATRLRQQLVQLLAQTNDASIRHQIEEAKKHLCDYLLQGLSTILPAITATEGDPATPSKEAVTIAKIVDKACLLTLAIKGQEVDIEPQTLVPGETLFEERLMELAPKSSISQLSHDRDDQDADMESQTSVKGPPIKLMIWPIFIGRDEDHEFLEKGKVFV
ncbi:hypothetical protein BZG36_00693 [Bifiguratus adelaidae]|uniref:Uncharacterized protein n=1 Tax=Bifiguratus adelaidae TaxID=1938954 RepID=A0A261Y6Y5_9FUNG|nr:hypothetical protein BZG36_00693 [Bifiguratus adelaidae]